VGKILRKIKQLKMVDIYKAYFIAFFVIIFLFMVVNFQDIQFYFNDFKQIINSNLQVYTLDVGQAYSSIIILPNKSVMVIDTGSEESEKSWISEVSSILHKNKIKEIEFLVLTHSDSDHVGGAVALLEKFQVNNIFRPKILSSKDKVHADFRIVKTEVYANAIKAVLNEPNCNVEFTDDLFMTLADDLMIRFFSCKEDYYADINAYSPYIYLKYKERTFLFTGDAPFLRENELLEEFNENNFLLDIDFFFVPHHGSKHSSSQEFLQSLKPDYAFISAGDSLHPAQETIKRLKDNGVLDIFCTKSDGMIGIGIRADGTFVICSMSIYYEVPCIIVILTLVAMFVLHSGFFENLSKKRSFLIKK